MVNHLKTALLMMSVLLVACATPTKTPISLYEEIGGQPTIEAITDNFIDEISFNKDIYRYFEKTNITRFREKFIEHLCVDTGGPCTYTGDTMLKVHQGQKITETDFNLTVDLLVNAMKKAGLTYVQQNRVLKVLAPMRGEMLYK
ncbi:MULTISPECIES: group I truncated hemoglobin [Marinomonas]|uniref:Group 1 truncated hemoglobin n=1 Tax=Marinomonas arctica TaxID=383750 RepID=A0A7H1JAR5_9GAMM|nr:MULTISPECIES: group 1 truncated hemoglobin [Marinomonas]MCS7488501.1 globin [Marinomonas sp. BSi20414]QNT07581.1 group 1 truncated hemoglobin [Marinomonas arctica]GGN21007.1 group 1 truncated hemoglobin [Marinomonas arctica]